jgi:hypothetical protein
MSGHARNYSFWEKTGGGRELKMKFQKKQEMKLYMKSCLFLNLASAAT